MACECTGDAVLANLTSAEKYQTGGIILRKLTSLLEYEISEHHSDRQLELLSQYFQLSPQAHFVNDLTYVMRLLELLQKKIYENETFYKYYEYYLKMCNIPPILLRSSELLTCMRDLEEYFSVLGSLLFFLTSDDLRRIVLEVITNLLIRKCALPICCMPLDRLQDAAEKSRLPQILAHFLTFVDDDMYNQYLQICIYLADASTLSCHKIIEENAIQTLLIRMEPTWRMRCFATPPPHPTIDSQVLFYEKTSLLLWMLLNSLDDLSEEYRRKLVPPKQYSLWSLRYVLRYFCIKQGKSIDRNNVLCILLKIVDAFPACEFVKSGLALDVAILNTVGEANLGKTFWAKMVLEPNVEDFMFIKLLLMFLPYYTTTAHYGGLKYIASENVAYHKINAMRKTHKMKWHKDHFRAIVGLTITIFTNMASHILEHFMAERTLLRCMNIVEENEENGIELTILTLKAIVLIGNLKDANSKIVLNRLIEIDISSTLLDYCQRILEREVLDLEYQRSIELCFHILASIFKEQSGITNPQAIDISIALLRRALHPHKRDPVGDPRLVISVLYCLWKTLLLEEINMKQFVYSEGVYLILDIAQQSVWPIKIVALGVLLDISDEGAAIPFFITWRGKDNKKIIPFLLDLFGEENEEIGVKHNSDGLILDIEIPLMGKNQRTETCNIDSTFPYSPAIADILVSCRPKVYGLIQMITQVREEETRCANEIYRMFNDELTTKEQITMIVAVNYFALKLGEVWEELHLYFEKAAVRPIANDYDMLSAVITRSKKWNLHLKCAQEDVLRAEREQESINENLYYNDLREARLQHSLQAFKELSHIARCSKTLFRMRTKLKHNRQISVPKIQVDPNILYHTTFMYDIHVNPVFDQILYIASNKVNPPSSILKQPASQENTEQIERPTCEDLIAKDECCDEYP